MTLAEKLKAGLYWDMRGEYCGSDGEIWAQARVQRIAGIEMLGLVDEERDAVNAYHEYFATLRQDWKHMNISWNDVDFAIILGFLTTGPQATQRTRDLFWCFESLRIRQALDVRDTVSVKGFMTCWGVGIAAGAVTSLTGGLAAPITGPACVASWVSGFWLGVAGITISARDIAMWDMWMACCQGLQRRFVQSKELFRGAKAKRWRN